MGPGGGAPQFRVLLDTDWFGKSRRFKTGPAAVAALRTECSAFVLELLRLADVSFEKDLDHLDPGKLCVFVLRCCFLWAAHTGVFFSCSPPVLDGGSHGRYSSGCCNV
jgi:hypothetical protein